MLSVKNPSLVLPRCFAVVILCLSLIPSRASKAFEIVRSELAPATSADVVAFAAAAEQNSRLKLDLTWTFGAKTQRGWYLYVPLIQRLLNTDSGPETNAFAQALANWQRLAGLASTGILNQETWKDGGGVSVAPDQ